MVPGIMAGSFLGTRTKAEETIKLFIINWLQLWAAEVTQNTAECKAITIAATI